MPRSDAAAIYDEARGRILLFGGASQIDGNGDGIADLLGDTWEWTGTTWLQRDPTTAPSPRSAHAMAYDPVRARTVLFGGFVFPGGGTTRSNETWEWDVATWARQITSRQPIQREDHAMPYVPARAAVFVYAGEEGGGARAMCGHSLACERRRAAARPTLERTTGDTACSAGRGSVAVEAQEVVTRRAASGAGWR